ncbi:MAG TPA: glycosyltransferase [Pyrinomonadaceae bacterium]|jgi:glycosyltransferase involved in cell wall biosynthesis/SAM-dependent methyltransferase|nr:glycosyltransferase [Pyrinomonadaceae bacterium]
MNKIAIVVQRCHESIVGGSESLAWQYATLLKSAYEVDILTTTAVDAAYWANALPEGVEVREGVRIHRFHVDIGYSPYRTSIFERLLRDYETHRAGRNRGGGGNQGGARYVPWSISLQEEFIRRIGPYSDSLVSFIRQHWMDYRAMIFVTYLYPTAYFGLLEVPARRALFAPTLHDEQPAYLTAYKHAARRAHSLVWLSEGERRLGRDLWGELPGRIVAASIDTELREPVRRDEPYMLYCGRIDPNKGCRELFEYFMRFKESQPSKLRLVLTGKDDIPVPDHPDIEFRGFVSAEEKFRLMAGADVFAMPSGKESFSIVTLEAMAQRTPVLASGVCDVIVDHVTQSGGGQVYHDYQTFSDRLTEMLADRAGLAAMGERGRLYVTSRFQPEIVRRSLIEAIEACAAAEDNGRVAGAAIKSDETQSDVKSDESQSASEAQAASYAAPSQQNEARAASRLDAGISPPLPLPPGWSEEELRELVASVLVEDGPPEELRAYAEGDFRRFVYTLGLVPDRSDQALLELGANPYFTTTLLHKFRAARLHLANFFGHLEQEGVQKVTVQKTGEVISYRYKQFNIEEDVFPYADDAFDVVLFCEIIEHLLYDPVHALLEIRRVLKPGGHLILTTPNVARLDNVGKLIAGENVYDPYSGYGPYGRHNREYTTQDVFQLLSANGFNVTTLFTADVSPEQRPASGLFSLETVAPLLKHRRPEWGQYIFCQSTINPESKQSAPVRPGWLYRSMTNSDGAQVATPGESSPSEK